MRLRAVILSTGDHAYEDTPAEQSLVEKTQPDAVKTSISDVVLVRIRWARSRCLINSDAVQNRIRKP